MATREFKQSFDSNYLELRNLISSWNINSNFYLENISKKILNQLYENAERKTIIGIIKNELITNFGLFPNEFDSELLTTEILNWWNIEN